MNSYTQIDRKLPTMGNIYSEHFKVLEYIENYYCNKNCLNLTKEFCR